MNEPRTIYAGDYVTWSESFTDYPASDGWALAYVLRGPSSQTVTGSADGDDFTLAISATDSAKLLPGQYSFQGRVTKGTEIYTVSTGSLEVKQNLAATTQNIDARTHARKTLALLEAAIENHATNPVIQLTIGGRTLIRPSLGDLVRMRSQYQLLVDQEDAAERIARGETGTKQILVRFQTP